MPHAIDSPWPSEPVAASMPGSATRSGWPCSGLPSLRKRDELLLREVPGPRHHRVERRHRVALGEHDAVAIRPVGTLGVVAEATEGDGHEKIDHRERAARMPGPGVGEHADDLHAAVASDRVELACVSHQRSSSMNPAISSTRTPETATSGAYTTSSAAHTIVPLASLVTPTTLLRNVAMLSLMRMRVGPERRDDATVANDIGVGDHGTGEITRAQPVDRVGVPDASDVEPVADPAQQLLVRDGLRALDHDVGGRHAGRAVELPSAAGAEAEAVARVSAGLGERRRWRRACRRSAGSRSRRCALVPVGQTAGEPPVPDQIGASGGQAFAGDALGAHEARPRAVVVDGAAAARPPRRPRRAEERRARRRRTRSRDARGHDEVVHDVGHRLAAEDDRVAARRHALAAHRVDRRSARPPRRPRR